MLKRLFHLVPFQEVPGEDAQWKVSLERSPSELKLAFELEGSLEKLEIPELDLSSPRKNDLWKTTCFEVFLGAPDSETYFEWNFSPSSAWQLFSFNKIRNPSDLSKRSPLCGIQAQNWSREKNKLKLEVRLNCDFSDIFSWKLHSNNPLIIGLSAVLKKKSGELSYWALKHSESKPNFHTPNSFEKI